MACADLDCSEQLPNPCTGIAQFNAIYKVSAMGGWTKGVVSGTITENSLGAATLTLLSGGNGGLTITLSSRKKIVRVSYEVKRVSSSEYYDGHIFINDNGNTVYDVFAINNGGLIQEEWKSISVSPNIYGNSVIAFSAYASGGGTFEVRNVVVCYDN
jgi:hypothetical protein